MAGQYSTAITSPEVWELNQGLIDTTPPEEVDSDIQTTIGVEHRVELTAELGGYSTAEH